jgi:hypothetical protein
MSYDKMQDSTASSPAAKVVDEIQDESTASLHVTIVVDEMQDSAPSTPAAKVVDEMQDSTTSQPASEIFQDSTTIPHFPKKHEDQKKPFTLQWEKSSAA